MSSTIIVGGGVIGLSTAYELAMRGHAVTILERDQFGKKASWAGGGMLPASNAESAIHPIEHLEALSNRLHSQWARKLHGETGIDNGFRQCGGLYFARTPGEIASLAGIVSEWSERKIRFERIKTDEIANRFGDFSPLIECSKRIDSVWVPGESQFSNPRHLDALESACRQMGVSMHEGIGDVSIAFSKDAVDSIETIDNSFQGDHFLFACGPWTQQVIEPLGISLPMQPVRGQIVQYRLNPDDAAFSNGPIVYEGGRYLIPRTDGDVGYVLAGSTTEEAGFDCRTTEAEISELRHWAEGLSPTIANAEYIQSWAGLRPATFDGFPYLGKLDGFQNCLVATGHFKSGLQLATGTAVVISDLIEGRSPTIDLTPFRPSRVIDHHEVDDSLGCPR